MEIIKSLNEIDSFIKDNVFSLVYATTKACNVCDVVLPKLQDILLDYPQIKYCKVDTEEIPEVAGAYNVFTIPTIIVYLEGKEILRQGRYINFIELDSVLDRFSKFV